MQCKKVKGVFRYDRYALRKLRGYGRYDFQESEDSGQGLSLRVYRWFASPLADIYILQYF